MLKVYSQIYDRTEFYKIFILILWYLTFKQNIYKLKIFIYNQKNEVKNILDYQW